MLIFSKTKLLLDVIENILKQKKYQFLRVDGNVKVKDRSAVIEEF